MRFNGQKLGDWYCGVIISLLYYLKTCIESFNTVNLIDSSSNIFSKAANHIAMLTKSILSWFSTYYIIFLAYTVAEYYNFLDHVPWFTHNSIYDHTYTIGLYEDFQSSCKRI